MGKICSDFYLQKSTGPTIPNNEEKHCQTNSSRKRKSRQLRRRKILFQKTTFQNTFQFILRETFQFELTIDVNLAYQFVVYFIVFICLFGAFALLNAVLKI